MHLHNSKAGEAHHERLEPGVPPAHVLHRRLDLPEVEAAVRKVLAVQRHVGAVDDAAKGAVGLQPPPERLEVVGLALLQGQGAVSGHVALESQM